MTYEEALKVIKNEKQCVIRAENCNRDCAKCDLLKPAQQILEAYNVAKESLEKQIRKKVIEDCMCPNCGADVTNQADNDYLFEHCYHCGQALDWSEYGK